MNQAQWLEFAHAALQAIGKKDSSVRIAFVSDRSIQKLNRQFRGISKPTDVLSFPSGPDEFSSESDSDLGDIAISVERAAVQADENGMDFEQEIAQLILHGLLHLCGYDHETDQGEMNRLELRMRRKLGL